MKIHFIGIGGIGISGLAKFMLSQGHEVSGSDISETVITKKLQKLGSKVVRHFLCRERVVVDIELVVHSVKQRVGPLGAAEPVVVVHA